MKKLNLILMALAVICVLVLIGLAFAQEDTEKPAGEDVKSTFETRGMGRMMGGPGMPGMMGMGPMRMRGRGGMMPSMGQPFMWERGGMMGFMGMMKELDLSQEQQDKINEILTLHRKDMIKKNADLEIAMVEMQNLMREDDLDMGAIKERLQEIANLEAEMKYSQIKAWADAKSVLTDEQKEALKKIPKDKIDKAMERRSKPGPRPVPRRGR